MITSNGGRQPTRATVGAAGAVGTAHKTRGEHIRRHLLTALWQILFSSQASQIVRHLGCWVDLRVVVNQHTHGVHDGCHRAAVSAAGQGQEKARCARSPQKIPQPTCWTEAAFLLWRMKPQFAWLCDDAEEIGVRHVDVGQCQMGHRRILSCIGCLYAEAGDARSVASHIFQIDAGGYDFNVVQTELHSLSKNVSVAYDHGASVEVRPPPVTAALVGVKVHSTAFSCGAQNEFQPRLQFS